jgi:hypothetical protein
VYIRGFVKLFAVTPLSCTTEPIFTFNPVVVNVAVNAVISAGKGITTLMVFSDSFIVPAMPFTEYAEIQREYQNN